MTQFLRLDSLMGGNTMIRINRTLIKQAALNPTKNSRQDNILHICQMIDEQTLSVPLYQRDLSWTIAKSIVTIQLYHRKRTKAATCTVQGANRGLTAK